MPATSPRAITIFFCPPRWARPASPAAAAPATLADKVTRIKLELGLDETLPLAQAVTAANEAMGLPPGGSIADQVAELLMQLAIEM